MNKPYFDDTLSTCVLMDGVNTHYAFKNLNWAPDYKKLLSFLRKETLLRKIYYFVSLDRENEENSIVKLLDWLDYNGFNVRITDSDERKRGIEVDFTIEAMAMSPIVDQYILFTGNSQYTPLVKRLDSLGKTVVVCSTLLNQRMVGDSLRRAADSFVELDSLRCVIENEDRTKGNNGDVSHT